MVDLSGSVSVNGPVGTSTLGALFADEDDIIVSINTSTNSYDRRATRHYILNLATKKLTPYTTFREKVSHFSGLPTVINTKTEEVYMSYFLLSSNKKYAVVAYSWSDKKVLNELEGGYEATKSEQFLCDIEKEHCMPSAFSPGRRS